MTEMNKKIIAAIMSIALKKDEKVSIEKLDKNGEIIDNSSVCIDAVELRETLEDAYINIDDNDFIIVTGYYLSLDDGEITATWNGERFTAISEEIPEEIKESDELYNALLNDFSVGDLIFRESDILEKMENADRESYSNNTVKVNIDFFRDGRIIEWEDLAGGNSYIRDSWFSFSYCRQCFEPRDIDPNFYENVVEWWLEDNEKEVFKKACEKAVVESDWYDNLEDFEDSQDYEDLLEEMFPGAIEEAEKECLESLIDDAEYGVQLEYTLDSCHIKHKYITDRFGDDYIILKQNSIEEEEY